jgi:hypothetical protein
MYTSQQLRGGKEQTKSILSVFVLLSLSLPLSLSVCACVTHTHMQDLPFPFQRQSQFPVCSFGLPIPVSLPTYSLVQLFLLSSCIASYSSIYSYKQS